VSRDGHRPRRAGGRGRLTSPAVRRAATATPATRVGVLFPPRSPLEYERWDGRRAVHPGASRRPDRARRRDGSGVRLHWLCTSSWQAGNFLRHAGVREDVTVGVVGDGPLALLAFFGTTLLEGTTRFEPPTDLADADDFRALVAPVSALEEYDLPRGAQRVGYGSKPDAPDVHHFDAGIWTENPSFPPLAIDSETAILSDGERTVTHGDLLEAARAVLEETGLETDDRVVVRAPLSDPRPWRRGYSRRCWRRA